MALEVSTSSGVWRGWSGPVADHWSRVAYAAPLRTAEDRFAPPVPAPPLGEFDATLPSRIPLHEEAVDVELTLSIAAPRGSAGSAGSRPVLVFLHGGRFEYGHADEPIYRGDAFARDGVVYVAVNYRKRFAGFFPASRPARGQRVAPEFRGVQDVVCALRWVQQNIAQFGGDPKQVTLMGQSAGGGLAAYVLTLLEVQQEDLVHRAMVLSPGLPRGDWWGRWPLAKWLLGRVADPIEAYRWFASLFPGDIATGPAPFRAGEMADVPLLVSAMEQEFDVFPMAQQADAWAASAAPLDRLRGAALRRIAAWAVGAPQRVVRPGVPAGRAIGDSTILRWASAMLEGSTGAGRQGKTWGLLFRPGAVEEGAVYQPIAQHCADLPLFFDALSRNQAFSNMFCGPGAVHALQPEANWVHRLAVDFVHGVDPAWQPFDASQRVVNTVLMGNASSGKTLEEQVQDPFVQVRSQYPPVW